MKYCVRVCVVIHIPAYCQQSVLVSVCVCASARVCGCREHKYSRKNLGTFLENEICMMMQGFKPDQWLPVLIDVLIAPEGNWAAQSHFAPDWPASSRLGILLRTDAP